MNNKNMIIDRKIEGPNYRGLVKLDYINSRLKVLSYEGKGYQDMANACVKLATEEGLGKILWNFLKQQSKESINRELGLEELHEVGFVQEGKIPGFFRGQDALCYAYFVDKERSNSPYIIEEQRILEQAMAISEPGKTEAPLPLGFTLRPLGKEDIMNLVSLYRGVFESYPSPLFDPHYIKDIMNTHVFFVGVFEKGQLLAAGSAEMDLEHRNAEVTDLATKPEARGRGLSGSIIKALEVIMLNRNIACLYSLVRAGEPGANRGLFKLGYQYQGKHINNCHIDGRYENMNIWTKML
ncbi:putative beta-lysine N-acetyltransferase [Heliorestis acidaminivorans]|uniref:Putative beta-lysine N-acetyltransferase n=1 Tax=Heliorestis acidaminivorans TaxID=553427 RepID=A0A6I0F0A3_9FIRM|nr:putative beta-lysine N-acetyltransferase [Heliorestis acidaminivorans]KAB2952691.1 putative beta-lysine N-acetyltransferase [Heliorestis acidaminivorans]